MTIFEKQQELGNSSAEKELQQRYIDEILMYEERIDDYRLQKMMGHCEFTGGLCTPKESYTNERFILFNRLNTLELVDTQNKDKHLMLDDKHREKIGALAYNNAKVTFTQIRTELGLQGDLHVRFNLCSYGEKNPEYNKKLVCSVKDGRLEFEDKHKLQLVDITTGEITVLDKEIKDIFRKRKESWKNAKKLYVYYSDIRKQLNIPDNSRFADLMKGYTKSAVELEREIKAKGSKKAKTRLDGEAAYIKQFEDDTFIELKGNNKIKNAIEKHCGDNKWTELATDTNNLDIISEALVYHKSDETRT